MLRTTQYTYSCIPDTSFTIVPGLPFFLFFFIRSASQGSLILILPNYFSISIPLCFFLVSINLVIRSIKSKIDLGLSCSQCLHVISRMAVLETGKNGQFIYDHFHCNSFQFSHGPWRPLKLQCTPKSLCF